MPKALRDNAFSSQTAQVEPVSYQWLAGANPKPEGASDPTAHNGLVAGARKKGKSPSALAGNTKSDTLWGIPDGEIAGWLHTLHMEGGQTNCVLSLYRDDPFGKRGVNYDPLYYVTSEPLVRAALTREAGNE